MTVGAPVGGATAGRFCRHCGALLRPGARFCHHCGTEVTASAPVPVAAPAAPYAGAPAAPYAGAPVFPGSPGPAPTSPAPPYAGAPVFPGSPGPAPTSPAPPYAGAPAAPYAGAPVFPGSPAPAPTSPAPVAVWAPSLPGAGAPQWPQASLVTGQAARGRAHKGWFSRLPPIGKLAIVFLGLVLVGALAQSAIPSAPKCSYSCTISRGPVSPTGETYSTSLFSFNYPPELKTSQAAEGATVSLGGQNSVIDIWAGQGQESPTGLVQQYSQKLSSSVQDLTDLGPISGAQIGFVPGTGEFYSGQLQTQNGEDVPVGTGVIAAESGNTWAVIYVLTVCTDRQNGDQEACSEAGIQAQEENFGLAQAYDVILERWHWKS